MSESDTMEMARVAVVECEREIQLIKGALRKLGSDDSEQSDQNSLIVVWTAIDKEEIKSDPEVDVSLQLSSPIEEAVLKSVSADGDITTEESSTAFKGVETSVATLTVTLRKNGEVLGNSESYDLAPLCKLEDAMDPKDEYITELPVAIITPEEFAKKPTATTKTETEKTEEKEGGEEAAKDKDEQPKEDASEEKQADSGMIKPLCTLNFKIVFKPSTKDQKEELYEILNKASQRKSQALGKLRGAQSSEVSKTSSSSDKKPAVKSGFLNKKPKKQDEGKLKQFYNKYLGPDSWVRIVFPIAKNYIIFFGAVAACHFKGDMLALPAPV